jgi:hypothetical protein
VSASTSDLREKSAPRLAEHVVPPGDAERVDEVVQLPNEELGRPELGAAVRIVRAAPAAQLVVMHDRAAVGEVDEREEVVVRPARAAVEDDERRRPVGSQIARDPVPRLRVIAAVREGDGSLEYVHVAASLRWST